MAYQILSFVTSPFTQQRTYAILCDTAADLPASVDGYSVAQGFTAKIIEDGSTYIADSSGTWKKQPDGIQLDLSGYYTAAQTDSLLAGKQDSLSASQLAAASSGITQAVLQSMISGVSKNKLAFTLAELQSLNTAGTWAGSSYTRRGITFTVNADMTITASGTNDGSGSSWLDLKASNTFVGLNGVGCPAGGGSSSYQIQFGNDRYDNGSGSITNTGSVGIVVRENVTVTDLTFEPMIISTQDLQDSPGYSPYFLSLGQLYQLVKSYHP